MKRITALFNILTLLFMSTLIINGCIKEEERIPRTEQEEPDKVAENELIIKSQSWQITNLVTGGFSVWNTPLIEDCFKDNIYTFLEDYSLEIDEGPLKCNDTDPQSFMGEWKLIDENSIYVDALIFSDTATILEISSTRMVIDGTFMDQDAVVTFSPN